ncbi:cell division ATP-binding protein FtsE [Candidatus Woesebacteria bacterium RBG_19FT_COMBO_47_8]|uniref:Cell division ATP-binding protein FtsE n=1 Tax=Candidatus Woesebacteria bacterium RBG_13_46_13 TaxID=1802479 RepID=A0A1F7X5I2_9BACT|nr:MAG: cell division ATP-binding protein FtsE [Candidatus Woesebacteria bacterium RBG_13_46_13]OGM17057.1 MAG: cell division ATP-binding protein FtsE [Candidatus Woesebacteria bacterium RBG_19FT_COMBO_47_8]HJX59064.1 cell division ATP-binding protein FtsE [Patescibacteria group bacterium]
MIQFKKVSKSFGTIKALEEVSFEVGKGEFVYITGPSGAGKTTLLKLILREYQPDSGEIVLEGVDITKLSDEQIPEYRQKIGVVFQDFKVLPERTVRENVEVSLAVIGVAQEAWSARVGQVLKLVGLAERADLFPNQLSGGEIQRVSLARALVVNPKIILADEPTGNLDWETADSMMELFEKINKEGKTIIMATHNKVIVDKFKKRVIKLKGGKNVGKEKVHELEKEPKKEENEKGEGKMKVKVEEV